MIEQYTSPAVVNNSQEPWLVGEGVSLSGSIAIPSLDFNFVTNAFPGTVTFSRASSATMFDSSGTLVYAPMNAIRNNTMAGAVAGTPGTLPTNWQITGSGLGTLTREVVGTGVVNGITYIDLRISGTTSTTGFNYAFEPTVGGPASSSGQTWTSSVYVALVGGSISNINQISGAAAVGRTSGGAGTTDNFTSGDNKAALTSTLQRFSATGTLADAATVSLQPYARVTFSSGVAIDITLRIGLPQLELGSVARTAIATSGTAYQGPRLDYDPATLLPRGFLVEEQRTNSIRNNTMQGAVAGAPGTLPTNWASSVGALTYEVVGTGTENGITYIDLRFNGTPSATTAQTLTADSLVSSIGATWAVSAWIKLQAGTFTNVSQFTLRVADEAGGTVFTPTGTLTRYGNVRTLAATSAAWRIRWAYTDTVTPVDFTLRIGLPQLELGAFATSIIPTTTTALTRSADVASVNTLSPWFNATEGTLFVEASPQASNNNSYVIAGINDATASNRITLSKLVTTGNAALSVLVSGVTQASTNSGAWTATGKLAGAYKLDDFASSLNGSAAATDTSGTIPTVTQLTLGRRGDGGNQLTGHIRRITYYPRRLSNAELQAITA